MTKARKVSKGEKVYGFYDLGDVPGDVIIVGMFIGIILSAYHIIMMVAAETVAGWYRFGVLTADLVIAFVLMEVLFYGDRQTTRQMESMINLDTYTGCIVMMKIVLFALSITAVTALMHLGILIWEICLHITLHIITVIAAVVGIVALAAGLIYGFYRLNTLKFPKKR